MPRALAAVFAIGGFAAPANAALLVYEGSAVPEPASVAVLKLVGLVGLHRFDAYRHNESGGGNFVMFDGHAESIGDPQQAGYAIQARELAGQ
ncbi:MAG: H-X9-DG-CTERM domain-containing protein [Planctomycetota bacterium]